MGKIGDITVQTDGGKEVYRAGEEVKGVWRVNINERVTVDDIYISFHGESYVKWTESSSRAPDLKFISREEYNRELKYVVYKKTTLEAGVHEYPFSFRLPNDKMPSSFEGKRGCSRYWLYLKISRPLPWRDVVSDKCITYIDDVNINLQYYNKPVRKKKSTRLSKMLGLGDAGEVTLTAKVNRTGFCAGESVPVTVDAINASTKDLGKLKVSLVQKVVYKANGEEKVERTVIYTKTGSDPIKQGQTRSWKDELIYIDAIPPSTRMRTSFCLVVSYFIKVYIDISFLSGGDLELWLPITIGTVPQGYKKTIPVKGATSASPNIPVVDLSNALTHTRCNRGWERFSRSTDNAIPEYVCYTPMCVYVPNYTYKPKPLVANPPKQGPMKTTQVSTAASKSATPSVSTSSPKSVAGSKPASKSPVRIQTTVPASSPKTSAATPMPASESPTRLQTSVPASGKTTLAATALQASKNATHIQTSVPASGPMMPAATVTPTSNSRLEGQGQPEPSAPPLICDEDEAYNMHDERVSLPSYEDLFGQGAAEGKIEVEETSTGKVFMLIRFRTSKREEFVNTLKNYSTGLEKFQGYLSALQHKVPSVRSGKWEKASVLAILTFENEDMAQDWLKSTPEVCMEKWLGGCDILLMESSEPFQQDHQVLSISNTVINGEDVETNKDLARYRYILDQYLKPARVRIGGVSVARSQTSKCLRGQWDIDLKSTVNILSWPTVAVLRQYKESVDPEIYQESLDLRGKVFDIVLSVVIQLGQLPSFTNAKEDEAGEAGPS
ncbi:uncharacterized protein LOC117338339 [Pecten maximus]|uniref:uncharacterized protein LOC117338339 n=1 Tax=Pecten maximus TaxID=6579 RepID=UPI001458627E|nr:uncharacterized protein LOC117338339 [Pecten maximus]